MKQYVITGPFSQKEFFCRILNFTCKHLSEAPGELYCIHPDATFPEVPPTYATPSECPFKPKSDPCEEPQP